MRRFKHLSKTDRLRIEALKIAGSTPKEISDIVGVHISTIYRELKRGMYMHRLTNWTEVPRYSADIAEAKYQENLRNKGADLKIGRDHKLAEYIEHRIADDKYSPAAVIGEIRTQGLHFNTTICVNTVYSYISKGVFFRITNRDLHVKGAKKRKYHKVKVNKMAAKGDSIERRPGEVDSRQTFGHWEMDTVLSARPCTKALLVLTERKTRMEIIRLIDDKSTDSVVSAMDAIEIEMGASIFRTITCDNGREFRDAQGIERSVTGNGKRVKVFYAHPYSAYERGSNENANKLIRRFLPKGTNFENLTEYEVAQIEKWINSYPRKILGFRSAENVFDEIIEKYL